MKCGICGGATRVIRTEDTERLTERRRECTECKDRFSTVENRKDYVSLLERMMNVAREAVQSFGVERTELD